MLRDKLRRGTIRTEQVGAASCFNEPVGEQAQEVAALEVDLGLVQLRVGDQPECGAQRPDRFDGDDFTHPTYRAVWDAVTACGGPSAAPASEVWVGKLQGNVSEQSVAQALNALAVEPLLSSKEPNAAYVAAHVYRLQELTVMRRIADLKSRLQRTNPVDDAVDYNRMFGELVALEQHRRNLRESAIGSAG